MGECLPPLAADKVPPRLVQATGGGSYTEGGIAIKAASKPIIVSTLTRHLIREQARATGTKVALLRRPSQRRGEEGHG